MKSNVDTRSFGRAQRAKEAELLVAQLDAVRSHFHDDDIVLIGDTNVLNRNERAIDLFSSAGYRDLNSGDAGTFVRRRSPFDRIFVPRREREFRFSRQYILTATEPKEHEKYLSDHFMVLTVVKILEDDDTN